MVRRVLVIVGLVGGLLVGGVAPAALAAPAPSASSMSGQQTPGTEEPPPPSGEEPPPPTCEPNVPPTPDPDINYCSPRERVLLQVRAQLQRVADRLQNPRARVALQRVIARLR